MKRKETDIQETREDLAHMKEQEDFRKASNNRFLTITLNPPHTGRRNSRRRLIRMLTSHSR
jgi:hypothetical protein